MYTYNMYLNKRISVSLKKEGSFAILNNIGVSRGHYAKWNKPDRQQYRCI